MGSGERGDRVKICPVPRPRGVTDEQVSRIVKLIAQAMVAEDRGLIEVDWRQVAELVEDLGLDWEAVKGAARARKREVEKEAAEVRTLQAWFRKGHRLRGI